MDADLWPHIWLFRAWAGWWSAVLPFDPFNPNLEAVEPN
jgi:hypothetical protein